MKYNLVSYKKSSQRLLSSAGSPPGGPPKKPTATSSPAFDGFPPIRSKKAEEKIIEQTVVHLLWDKLAKLGFEVYPEQFINRHKRIDLIAVKGNQAIGIEVKCKKRLSDSDLRQISEYTTILDKLNIPLLTFWVPTELYGVPAPFMKADIKYILNQDMTLRYSLSDAQQKTQLRAELFFESVIIGLISVTDDLTLRLDSNVLKANLNSCVAEAFGEGYICEYQPENLETVLREFMEKSDNDSLEKISQYLHKERELVIEHALWEFLTDRGHRVLCQYPIPSKTGTQKIDVLGIIRGGDPLIGHHKIGIEVKQRLTHRGTIQTSDYKNRLLPYQTYTYIGIPPQGIPKKFQTFKQRIKEIEANQLGLALIDPHTTIVEFYEPPFSESEIKDIFNSRHTEKETKETRRLTEYGIKA
ncbi:hypothetical protein JCM16307_16360 [Thermococcus prieurii]